MLGECVAQGKGIQKPAQHTDSLPFAMLMHREAGNDKWFYLNALRSKIVHENCDGNFRGHGLNRGKL